MHGSLEPNKLSKLCDKPTEMMVTKYSLSFYGKDVRHKNSSPVSSIRLS